MKMPRFKWMIIAKNQYYISTSRIRIIRPYLLYLVTAILVAYLIYLAPLIVTIFIDRLVALLLSQIALAIMRLLLFIFFIYFMLIPISNTLRSVQANQLENLLAAPIKSSDLLLGEFMGRLPIYSIIIVIVAGAFSAIFSSMGLDSLQIGLIVGVFVLTIFTSFWLGTLVSSLLRTRLEKTARGRDIGRALSMIIALPLVAVIYGTMGGGIGEALADPSTGGLANTVLGFLPSSWGADLIVDFARNPGNIGAIGITTFYRFGGIVLFFVGSLWIGAKIADRAYNLEPSSFTASTVKSDGLFYSSIEKVGGGGSFGKILVSIFKDYGRRLENLSNIAYILGVLVVMNIFLFSNQPVGLDDPPTGIIAAQFLFPIVTIMIVGEVTIRGKDNLFIYRKSPSGEWRYIRAKMVHGWMIVLPIVAAVMTLLALPLANSSLLNLLTITGLMVLIVAAHVVLIIGLFLINPAFSEKSPKIWINIIIAIAVTLIFFILSLVYVLNTDMGVTDGIISFMMLQVPLNWAAAMVFLYFGKIRLNRLE
jgi:hypothetical protein